MKIKTNKDKIFIFINYSFAIVLGILVLYPLIYVLSASMSDPLHIANGTLRLFPKDFTMKAYTTVFRSKNILIGYRNTIVYSIIGTLVNVVLTIMAAYPLSRKDLAGRNFFIKAITFTMFFSGGMIPSYLNIRDLGLLDSFWVMILPGAINATNLIIVRNYFQYSVPEELIEAAEIDGSSNVGTLVKIVLPVSKSVIAVISIYYFVGHWNQYFNALIYLRDSNKYPLQVFLREILLRNQMGDMSADGAVDYVENVLIYEALKYAVIVVSSVPVLVFYPFFQKYFVQGVMVGSLKA